jgi:hypothetical protein
MSSQQVTDKAKETLKNMKELLGKAEGSAKKTMARAAPAVQKSLDSSIDAAAKGFNSTLRTIDTRTLKEQKELLGAYRRFLASQVDLLDAGLKAIEERISSKPE